MEWRQQTSLSCADAFNEAQRWIEEVTGKCFDCIDFRAALENGVLLCDLINKLKPGIIKRVNRLSTPIAGLDNVSVFLKACGKLGLNESQLFHPGDLQDLSTRVTLKRDEGSRRLKNVLITIYWLGRKAHQDLFYKGPQLNFKCFEGLLGLALSRALEDATNCYYQEKEIIQCKRPSYKRQSSLDSSDSPDAKATTNSEGCGSDAEAEQVFKMETSQAAAHSNRGHVPAPLQKVKQARGEKTCTSPMSRSKSLTDIPMVYPVRNVPEESTVLDQEPGTIQFKRRSFATKDTEAQWHEDLNKWKSRRRSCKTEARRMSQDREHVLHQMTNGAKTTFQKTQGGPMKRDPAPHPYPTTSPTKSSRSSLRPHTRALLTRSYATEMPYNSPPSCCSHNSGHIQGLSIGTMPGSVANISDKDNHVASLASVGTAATTPSTEHPFSSQTQVKSRSAKSQNNCVLSSVLPKEMTKLNAAAEELTLVSKIDIDAINDPTKTTTYSEKQEVNMEPFSSQQGLEARFLPQAGTWSGSSSLPRGYRRSEGSSRLSTVMSARPFGAKPSRVSSLPRLCNVDDNQQNWLSSNDPDVSPPVTTVLKRQKVTAHLKGQAPVTAALMHTEPGAEQKENGPIQSPAPDLPQHSRATLGKESSAPVSVDHSDMRVCLTLRPNSRQDFGFETHWESTGVRLKSIQPGSPAELCHLCINDEIISVDGANVAQLTFKQWKNKMTSALQTGSLTMDIRRYGNRGGSESAISDLQVPSLSPSSSSWSWDKEGERRRQEKWQEEQERLLQEKYQRDQERLEAEWRKAQQDASSDKNDELKMVSSDESLQRCVHVNGIWSKTQDDQSPAADEMKSTQNSPCESTEMQHGKQSADWADGSQGFVQLSAAHRAKSMSTPALTSPQKQTRGASDQRKRKSQTVSKAEQERQQILDEMKKRTQLLTDNSWIRQRSASFYKEPIMPGVPIKRYESMDHLESWRHTPVSSMTFSRPQSAAAGFCGSSRNPSSRHSTGSMHPQRSSAWAVTEICEEQRQGSTSGSTTTGHTAKPATSTSNPMAASCCDQNTELLITE